MTRWHEYFPRCSYASNIKTWMTLLVLAFIAPCIAWAYDKAEERGGQQAQAALGTPRSSEHGAQVFVS